MSSCADTSPRVRCAIYTRKSDENGLEQEFNSLDAQREACAAYIASQRHEGWILGPGHIYDEGGFSGKDLERPAMKRLMADIEAGKLDMIVVYKVDRLSRSLLDFARLIGLLDKHNVSFVSITQHFNTKTSMGRLILNILLSFAQFEREMISDRVRDKIAGAKKKGKYTGGTPVLGYDVDCEKHRLVVNAQEAETVRWMFRCFLETGSGLQIARELNAKGITTKSWVTNKGVMRQGKEWNASIIYRILNNRTYLGETTHIDQVYPGEHEAIVPRKLWDRVHAILATNSRRDQRSNDKEPSLLRGIIRCGHCDRAMTNTYSYGNGRGRTYRYYVCTRASKSGYDACPVKTVAAGEIEDAVIGQLRAIFRSPEMIAQVFLSAKEAEAQELDRLCLAKADLESELEELARRRVQALSSSGASDASGQELALLDDEMAATEQRLQDVGSELLLRQGHLVTERDVTDSLAKLGGAWSELFPIEQQRIVRLLVARVTVTTDGLDVRIRADGLHSLVTELRSPGHEQPEEAST